MCPWNFKTTWQKGKELKVKNFEGLIPAFGEVAGKNDGRGRGLSDPPHPEQGQWIIWSRSDQNCFN